MVIQDAMEDDRARLHQEQDKGGPFGWRIEKNVKPIPTRNHDYDFWSDDYDGADGGSGFYGTASSFEDAVEQIKEIEELGA